MGISMKLELFERTVKRSGQILLCVACGSAQVEQPALDRLVCRGCGNFIAWDGLSFSLAPAACPRPDQATMQSARKAFRLRDGVPSWVSAAEAQLCGPKGRASQGPIDLENAPAAPKSASVSGTAAAQAIWDHWQSKGNLITHRPSSPPAEVQAVIFRRLKDGYDVETIKRAIDGLDRVVGLGRALGCASWGLKTFLQRESGGKIDLFANPRFDGWGRHAPRIMEGFR